MSASKTACAVGQPARPGRLIQCRVNVRTATGERHSYTALFKSTFGAAMDALGRFGISKIRVEAAR